MTEDTREENERVLNALGWDRGQTDKTSELLSELRAALERADAARIECERRKDDWLDAKAAHRRAIELVYEIESEIVSGPDRPILGACGTLEGGGA